jgi:hypothetical protein
LDGFGGLRLLHLIADPHENTPHNPTKSDVGKNTPNEAKHEQDLHPKIQEALGQPFSHRHCNTVTNEFR